MATNYTTTSTGVTFTELPTLPVLTPSTTSTSATFTAGNTAPAPPTNLSATIL